PRRGPGGRARRRDRPGEGASAPLEMAGGQIMPGISDDDRGGGRLGHVGGLRSTWEILGGDFLTRRLPCLSGKVVSRPGHKINATVPAYRVTDGVVLGLETTSPDKHSLLDVKKSPPQFVPPLVLAPPSTTARAWQNWRPVT